MKKTTAILFFLLPLVITGQNNLVPNPGFEEGDTFDQCGWDTRTSPLPNIPWPLFRPNAFDPYVDNWFVARQSNRQKWDVASYLDIDINNCSLKYLGSCSSFISPNPALLPSKRFVDMYARLRKNAKAKKLKKYRHCAIRAHLFEALDIGATYILRIKFVALAPAQNKSELTFSGKNHLKIHFTKWGPHWSSNSNNNQKFLHAVDIERTKTVASCSWEFAEEEFTVPNDNDHNQLQYMIIYVEEGRFIIDEVAVFKKCPDEMLIENKVYDMYFYSPLHSNIPFVNHASNIIKAGYDAGAPTANGNVIVQQHADVTFRAGNRIELLPGFSIESFGAKFIAEISPCAGQGKKGDDEDNDYDTTIISSPEPRDEPYDEPLPNDINTTTDFSIHPNPTNGEFTIQVTGDIGKGTSEVYIYDIFGRLIYQSSIFNNQSTIDIAQNAKGIYLVKVIQGEEIYIKKLILQ